MLCCETLAATCLSSGNLQLVRVHVFFCLLDAIIFYSTTLILLAYWIVTTEPLLRPHPCPAPIPPQRYSLIEKYAAKCESVVRYRWQPDYVNALPKSSLPVGVDVNVVEWEEITGIAQMPTLEMRENIAHASSDFGREDVVNIKDRRDEILPA